MRLPGELSPLALVDNEVQRLWTLTYGDGGDRPVTRFTNGTLSGIIEVSLPIRDLRDERAYLLSNSLLVLRTEASRSAYVYDTLRGYVAGWADIDHLSGLDEIYAVLHAERCGFREKEAVLAGCG